jgi:hypothetical protein
VLHANAKAPLPIFSTWQGIIAAAAAADTLIRKKGRVTYGVFIIYFH